VQDKITVSLLNLRLQSGTNTEHMQFAAAVALPFKKTPIENFGIV